MLKRVNNKVAYAGDWKNAEIYPIGSESSKRIAWEYLRRNELYAKSAILMLALGKKKFKNGIPKDSDVVLDGLVCTPPARPAETAAAYFKRMPRGKIETPAITFRKMWALKWPVKAHCPYDEKIVKFLKNTVTYRVSTTSPRKHVIVLSPTEIMVRFRLNYSIADQWSVAKRILETQSAAFFANLPDEKSSQGRLKDFNVHYGLRSYDALTGAPLKDRNSKSRRALENGAVSIARTFTAEKKTASKSQVEGWANVANSFINHGRYKLLLKLNKEPSVEENMVGDPAKYFFGNDR